MSTAESTDHLQLECIRLSDAGASEMDEHRAVIFVPREKIHRLELAFGSGAENPMVMLVLGLVFLALAIAPLVVFALMIIRDQGKMDVYFLTAVGFVIPGWWLLDLALRRRWYVRVQMQSGSRKLVFHKLRDPSAIASFMADAARRFGYLYVNTAERSG